MYFLQKKNNFVSESVILCYVYIVTSHLSKLAGVSNVTRPPAYLRSSLLLSRKPAVVLIIRLKLDHFYIEVSFKVGLLTDLNMRVLSGLPRQVLMSRQMLIGRHQINALSTFVMLLVYV